MSDFTIISSKNDVVLSKSNIKNNSYRISFIIHAGKFVDLRDHINLTLYSTLLSINQDVFEDIIVTPLPDPNEAYVEMKLRQIAKDLNMAPRYIGTKVKILYDTNTGAACIVGNNANLNVPDGYAEAKCAYSQLFCFWNETKDQIVVQYDFEITDESLPANLPDKLKNFSALLMKKVFIAMKAHKELELSKSI